MSAPTYAPELEPLLQTSVGGGKRFRALAAAVGRLCADQASGSLDDVMDDQLLSLGAALEFYQAAALVHDDVIDRSAQRRGNPSFHSALEAWHVEQAWHGEADHFGLAGAILAGDYLLASAHAALQRASRSSSDWRGLAQRFSLMETEVAYGQYLDLRVSQTHLLGTAGPQFSPVAQALEVIRLKSARYSVVHPVVLGALQEAADKDLIDWLERIFEPAGLAFQLRDDHLGVFGDQTETGKPTGSDILERKRTVLLAVTVQRADSAARAQLLEIYGGFEDPDTAQVEVAREIIGRFGESEHERLIDQYHLEATRLLQDAPFSREAKEACSYLTDRLINRTN